LGIIPSSLSRLRERLDGIIPKAVCIETQETGDSANGADRVSIHA